MHPWRVRLWLDRLDAVPPGEQTLVQANTVVTLLSRNMSITAAEGLSRRSVLEANELGVTFEWLTATGTSGGPGSMRATFLQGQPYLTVRVNALTLAVQQFAAAPLVEGLGTFNGSSFKVRGTAMVYMSLTDSLKSHDSDVPSIGNGQECRHVPRWPSV